MNGWAYLVVWSMLAGGVDVVDKEDWPEIQKALHEICVEEEILDPREVRYIFSRIDDLENDLNIIRNRYQDLKDCPKLSSSQHLVERSMVTEWLAFNRAYGRYLDIQLNSTTINTEIVVLQACKKENDQLYQMWDLVRDIKCPYYYITVRRQAIKKLKDMIGDLNYYNGDLPQHIPLHRFLEISW